MVKRRILTIYISDLFDDFMNKLIEMKRYKSRSDFITTALNEFLDDEISFKNNILLFNKYGCDKKC